MIHRFLVLLALACITLQPLHAQSPRGSVTTDKLTSTILRENRIGLNPERKVKVYLPPGYATSRKSYPVVYYFHSIFTSFDRLLDDTNIVALMERGFASGVSKEFILVVADYTTPTCGSVYENSPVSGRWLDFTVQELVPYIDGKYRTHKSRDSRAAIGHFMGGRGALKMGMEHADIFSVIYALHPVATGIGNQPWATLQLDWKKIYAAKSQSEITEGFPQLFITICQAFTPNLNRPPFYCDFFMEPDEKGNAAVHSQNTAKAKHGFHLEETLTESYTNLRTLRALAIDWGRFDGVEAHVLSNRNFSRNLMDLGIPHEAEEYAGGAFDKNWTEDGRFYTRVLPFLNRHLVF
jgi:S-formylglutathione hydrolase FrmB